MGHGIGVRSGLVSLVLAVMLSVTTATNAEAGFWCWIFGSGCGRGGTTQQTSPTRGAPELDPQMLAGVVALAAGGAALIGDRVRRRRR